MKLYFAGSITGGRDDQDLYREIITMLSSYGKVLTEHIGGKNLTGMGETHLSAQEICERDLDWVRESDALIAEVTVASMGVGYEIGFAEALKKPILCVYRQLEGKRVSAMISGNKNLKSVAYSGLSDLKPIFDTFFSALS